jgi:outer membrane protein OmpA-like peptidoglycan-associated protein
MRKAFMKSLRRWLIGTVLTVTFASRPVLAHPDAYDDSQSHPLRVAAYLVHPIGFLAEWLIYRPFHLLVSGTEPQEAFFGHQPHPPVLAAPMPTPDYSPAKRVYATPMHIQPQAPAPVPPPETVKIVEVPVEKIVIREVTVQKIVEIEKIVFPAVAFAFDSANLTDLGKGQVYLAAQRFKEKNDLTVVIEGHTDNRGADDYNQKLGLERTQTVMNELVALGIDRSRMSNTSIGEGKPLIGQDTAWARAVNRRVEFQVKAAR